MATDIPTQAQEVVTFKTSVKDLIKASKYGEAKNFVVEYLKNTPASSETDIRERTTIAHWETKVYLNLFDLKILTTVCLGKIKTLLEQIEGTEALALHYSEIELDQCKAELLYLERSILVMAMTADSQEPLKTIEDTIMNVPENKTDLLIVKYYVKALLLNDEFEIDTESKVGYQQLLKAQRIDNEVLVRQHNHKKETIRIQLNKMQKFKQFMDLSGFDVCSGKAMGTHRQKPEVVQILRALAMKHSDAGNIDKAMNYIERAGQLADQHLQSKDDVQVLLNMTTKIDIMLKKLRNGTEEEFKEPISIAKQAVDLSVKLFGENTFMSNQTVLTYAIVLTKVPSMEEESKRMFAKAESMFQVIAYQVSPLIAERSNLMFNMILHYNFMLNDCAGAVEPSKRLELINRLTEIKDNNFNKTKLQFQLMKRALLTIQKVFIEEDPCCMIEEFESLLEQIKSEIGGIPNPSYIGLMLEYFLSNLYIRSGDAAKGLALAKQLIEIDIKSYFGHMQTEITIEPMMIILNAKFDQLSQMSMGPESTQEQRVAYSKLFKEVQALAKETEKEVIAIQGDKSEKLIDIFSLYSFFAFQEKKGDEVMIYQRKSTELAREAFGGEMNQMFLQRLQEQIQMAMQTNALKPKDLLADTEKAVTIAQEVLKEPHEQEALLGVLNLHFDACQQVNDNKKALLVIEDILKIYRPMSVQMSAETGGKPDDNLIFYLFKYSTMLFQDEREAESVAAHKESYKLAFSDPSAPETAHLKPQILAWQKQQEKNAQIKLDAAKAKKEAEIKAKEQAERKAAKAKAKAEGDLDVSDISQTPTEVKQAKEVNKSSDSETSVFNPQTSSGKFLLAGAVIATISGLGYLVMRSKNNKN